MKKKIDIKYVSHLARIKMAASELKKFEKQFTDILSYIEKLNKLDTSRVSPTSHIIPVKNITRKDKVTSSLPVEKALGNAPGKKSNLFKVPKIVEEA